MPQTKLWLSLRPMYQLNPYWTRLPVGKYEEVSFSIHPHAYGFQRTVLAEPAGQVENWALSLADGSRLHLWLMPDGRWIMHRDGIDPARGPIHAVAHAVTESSVGQFLMGAAIAAVVIGGLGALIKHTASA